MPSSTMRAEDFLVALAEGQADMIEARLGWLMVKVGDLLIRRGSTWATSDGRSVPLWAVKHHWGTAFVPAGWRPTKTVLTLLERRAFFLKSRRSRR